MIQRSPYNESLRYTKSNNQSRTNTVLMSLPFHSTNFQCLGINSVPFNITQNLMSCNTSHLLTSFNDLTEIPNTVPLSSNLLLSNLLLNHNPHFSDPDV